MFFYILDKETKEANKGTNALFETSMIVKYLQTHLSSLRAVGELKEHISLDKVAHFYLSNPSSWRALASWLMNLDS